MRRIPPPARRSATRRSSSRIWDDFALFYLGSIVTVQALVDGNKRVGKVAYALTLIKGGRPFRSPVPKLENELYRMN